MSVRLIVAWLDCARAFDLVCNRTLRLSQACARTSQSQHCGRYENALARARWADEMRDEVDRLRGAKRRRPPLDRRRRCRRIGAPRDPKINISQSLATRNDE